MAIRLCFISKPYSFPVYDEMAIDFQYYSGFSLSQKQKSIESLHRNINEYNRDFRVLEISTKSINPIGVAASAFNLQFYDEILKRNYSIENIFQSSKVFERGGPYRDLLNVHPRDAKRDERLKTSGKLTHFDYSGAIWELVPKTMFYDWIYIKAISRTSSVSTKLIEYNAFTDIEFNHNKSINCQARSAAIYVSLLKSGKLEIALNDINEFRKIYSHHENHQITLFDL